MSKNNTLYRNYGDLDDSCLVKMAKEGSEGAFNTLFSRYISVIRKKSLAINVYSLEVEDVMQEGLIGLLDAVKSFLPEKEVKFSTYASVCIDNRIKKAISKVTTQKNEVLNKSLSLDDFSSVIAVSSNDPQNIYIEKEMLLGFKKQLNTILSSLERKVLTLYLAGQSYDFMAHSLGISVKSVDNALQRVRRKLK